MADPVTLSVLGSWAALEGIKFLYGQAGEVLKAWRARGADRKETLEVPILETAHLDQSPSTAVVDTAVLQQEAAGLAKLAGALAPYAEGLVDIDIDDVGLGVQAGRVREVLEAVYGQRLTLRGEQREPTGTRVTVRQVFGDVRGKAVGAEARVDGGADVAVHQRAETIGDGACVTGFKGTISS